MNLSEIKKHTYVNNNFFYQFVNNLSELFLCKLNVLGIVHVDDFFVFLFLSVLVQRRAIVL